MKNYIVSLIIGLFLMLPLGAQAQLLEVKQTVFGMDCAPCAYGLEKRIHQLEGVQSVSVSLNDGLLTVNLNNNNQLTLQRIRKAVKESGFKAKKAEITIAGTLTKSESGNFVLETGSGERFMLKAENKSTLETVAAAEGNIIISGKAEVSGKSETTLLVQTVTKSKSRIVF